MTVDPISLTIYQRRLESIADEMSHVLRRTAYSPNIKERADFSCAIFDHEGNLLAQAEAIPVHLGSMPFVAKPIIKMFPNLRPGDAIVTNSPRSEFGGTHLPDITLLAPVFLDDKLSFVVANRAHHADVGGIAPGSLPAKSTEIFQEGLIIPPVRLYQSGEENSDLMRFIMENVRTPYERRGDLRAQYSSLRLGVKRLHELRDEQSDWDFGSLQKELRETSYTGTKKLLEEYGEGVGSFQDYLDNDGNGKPALIRCQVTLGGGMITFDFTGSDPETPGNCNAPLSVTTSACYYAVRLLTGRSVPTNEGCFGPVTVIAPENSIVNPSRNAATSSANTETSQRITDVILGALSNFIDLPVASQGTMNNLIIGGKHNGENWSIYETIGGGTGGGPTGEGTDAIQSHMTNTENTPVEALELAYPLRVNEYSIRVGSGGKGEKRGGNGIIREIELLDTATINIQSERRVYPPYGSHDENQGSVGKNIFKFPSPLSGDGMIINEDDGWDSSTSRVVIPNAPKGSTIRIETPGGGGWSGDEND
ncbi:MAG: hydantoinase B/oxoprolinase family protein [Candidatus Kariarchaeaceae archaeon]|jgi:N-methylhydantoinase B